MEGILETQGLAKCIFVLMSCRTAKPPLPLEQPGQGSPQWALIRTNSEYQFWTLKFKFLGEGMLLVLGLLSTFDLIS